ncbi:MAG: L,D-transpeptidase family protein [Gammaproteobacteria bacterium]|nr:L,D-transpeptidase family protein [Gammaproteobacteria bacterium]
MRKLILLILLTCSLPATAFAALYHMPRNGNEMIGRVFTIRVKRGDNFNKLSKKYGMSYHEMIEANPGAKPNRLRLNQEIIIPAQFILPKYRQGIVINTVELRLYYFTPDGNYVFTTPVGLGRSGWRTPTTKARVIKKEQDPTWHIPKSIRQHAWETKGKVLPDSIPPGPKNPLGKYAIYLSHHGYLIHGTNSPRSIGKYFSSGCIRLPAAAIKLLFEHVPVGTKVYLINHASKAGWSNGELYLEVQQPMSHSESYSALNHQDVEQAIHHATLNKPAKIDWQRVNAVERQQTGIPRVIGYGLHSMSQTGVEMN